MNCGDRHLMVNHFPIILGITGTRAAVAAAIVHDSPILLEAPEGAAEEPPRSRRVEPSTRARKRGRPAA